MEIEEDVFVGFDLQKRHILNNTTSVTEFTTTTTSSSSTTTTSTFSLVHGTTAQYTHENGEQLLIGAEDCNENGEIEEEPNNGHNHILIDNQIADAGSMLYPTQIEGTNGFSADQNGADVADDKVHVSANGTSYSKAADTDIGLKCVESLLDESSSSVNGNLADITATELNKVGEILKSVTPEAAEYDVEGVIMKQETHDLFCPNCNSCITKRVILRRRKRKIQEISTGEGIISSDPAQISTVDDQIVEPSPVVQESAAVDALTCFSCFSIFIPTGKGFLFWKSASKPRIVHQQESSPDTPHPAQLPLSTEGAADASKDDEIGKSFPMWILTCCEPYKRERETAQQGESDAPVWSETESPGTHDTVTSVQPQHDAATTSPKPYHDITPGGDTLSTSELKPTMTRDREKSFHLWFLTCCQPDHKVELTGNPDRPSSSDAKSDIAPDADKRLPFEPKVPGTPEADMLSLSDVKSDISTDKDTMSSHESKLLGTPDADTPVSSEIRSPGTHDADASIQRKHDPATALPPIPNRDITPSDTMSPSGLKPTVTCDSEKSFSLWFLTCCQPGHKVEQNERSGKQPLLDAKSDIAPDADKLLPPELKVPGTPEADRPSPSYAKPDINTDKETDEQNQQSMQMHGQRISSNLTVIPLDVTEAVPEVKVQLTVTPGEPRKPNLTENPHYTPHISGAEQDLEAQSEPLLPSPSDEHPSRGASGLDVIKAIVYGGLLETIASLSIISSAAGGDATTLNIVALGLANVFGGLIVLFHNLRDLKNNRRHYEEQLGKTGHFVLHTTIAIMSYLVFGLMAPVVYGFSFRKNDDKNMKLITLAAASLICIVLLSIGKAYARRSSAKGYIKTIIYYASIGVLVSGLGYVSGELINDALKKLGVFDSESPVNMSVLETGAVKAAFSSY